MTKTLDVYFHEQIIGQLIQDDYGDMNFHYSENWLNSPTATSISCSLPLRNNVFKRKECTAFFNGILPEDTQRNLIAKHLGISANNDYSMLERIGGECAGALILIPAGSALNPIDYEYRELSNETLANTLRELPTRPLLAGDKNIRLSLAGVQDKIAVYVKDRQISIPLNNAPSTHILKPDFSNYEGVIFNEAFCLQLAKAIGFSVADVELQKIEDINYLLVKRYDRISKINENNMQSVYRLHQEDFCQALNILSKKKYQNEGGPSLKQCFDLLRRVTKRPVVNINNMLNAVIYNYIIGNCDAHGKNFSLLYNDEIQLAPLYDLVSTVYYKDLDRRMAMKLGGEYLIDDIGIRQFDKLAEEAGLAQPEVRKRILDITENIIETLPKLEFMHPVQEKVSELIKSRCVDLGSEIR